jgi:ABC-2 type transport system permease protein
MNSKELRGFRAVFLRELKRIVTKPVLLIVVFVLPILTIVFFSTMFKTGVPRDLPIAVYNADNSALSRQLVRMIDATPSVEVKFDVTDKLSGKNLMVKGQTYALVCIPKDFEKDVYKNKSPQVLNYYNNLYLVAGGVVSKDIATAVNTLSVGVNLNVRTKKGESRNQAIASILPVNLDTHVMYNPYTNYMYYLATCFMPLMLQIFLLLITVYVFGIEREHNTADEWYRVSGNNYLKAILGKLTPYTILFLILGFVVNYTLFVHHNISVKGNVFVLVLANVLFVVSYQAMGLIGVSLKPKIAESLSLGAGFGAMAFTFSGLTFHTDAMPTFSRIFSNIFPFSHYFKVFIDQTMKGMPLKNSIIPIGSLLIFILLAMLLNRLLIKGVFLTENEQDD